MIIRIPKKEYEKLMDHLDHPVELAGSGMGGKEPWLSIELQCHECNSVILDLFPKVKKPTKRKSKK